MNESPSIAVIGAANMDIGAQTALALLSGDSTPGQIHCAPGGVARNVAENLARLDHKVHLISAVGDDAFGASLLQVTQRAGVNTLGVQTLAGQRTATYLSLHGPDGDMAVAINDMAILECITPDFLRSAAGAIGQAAVRVLDCNLSADAIGFLLSGQFSSAAFVDAVSVVKCTKISPWLVNVHTLKVNRLEAQTLSGMSVHSVADACLAAVRLHQMGASRVVVSLGALGVCWCDAQGLTGHRRSPPMEVVNTSGAGDALLSGLVHGHVCDMPLGEAVNFAMACAELTLSGTFANSTLLSVTAANQRMVISDSHDGLNL